MVNFSFLLLLLLWTVWVGFNYYKQKIFNLGNKTMVLQMYGYQGENCVCVWDELGEWDWRAFTIDSVYKTDNEWEPIA